MFSRTLLTQHMLLWSKFSIAAEALSVSMPSREMTCIVGPRLRRGFTAEPPTDADATSPSVSPVEINPSGRGDSTGAIPTTERSQQNMSSGQRPTATLENAKLWRQWVDGKLDDRQRPAGLTSYTPSSANTSQMPARASWPQQQGSLTGTRTAPRFRPKDPSKDWKANSRSQRSAQDRIASLLVPGDDSGGAAHQSGRYGVLGSATDAPRHVPGAAAKAEEISPQRLLPHRLFYPGATYAPEDLDPYKAKPVEMMSDLIVRRGNISSRVVSAAADFRNPALLNNFIGPSGKLEPRRRTRLPSKLHREMVRQVKLARALAVMCPTAKVLPPRPPQQAGGPRRFNKADMSGNVV